MKYLFSALVFITLWQSCASNEIGDSADVSAKAVYKSYTITYTEGDKDIRCECQFRFGGKNGTTLVLNSPAGIKLDGNAMHLDSNFLIGAFYYANQAFDGFKGSHMIIYTDVNGLICPVTFTFNSKTCTTKLPATIGAKDLPLNFTGLQNGSPVHVVIGDTSYNTADIQEIDTIANNQLVIAGNKLATLADGPLSINFSIEGNTAIAATTDEGGTMRLYYKLAGKNTLLKK